MGLSNFRWSLFQSLQTFFDDNRSYYWVLGRCQAHYFKRFTFILKSHNTTMKQVILFPCFFDKLTTCLSHTASKPNSIPGSLISELYVPHKNLYTNDIFLYVINYYKTSALNDRCHFHSDKGECSLRTMDSHHPITQKFTVILTLIQL